MAGVGECFDVGALVFGLDKRINSIRLSEHQPKAQCLRPKTNAKPGISDLRLLRFKITKI